MDKNKIIEAAAKLVAKGAYDKAIKEYQKVLEADPKDVRILQKMGELFQKKNDNPQAAHYFTKVAESYSADGFFLKAVALYKQVLKLNPNLIDVNAKLAELHQQLGLMSEAMAYYQTVANAYDKQGNTKASLDTLKKMVDLDPENVASRIKLAELYARDGMEAEATQEFKRAADYLKRNNRTDDYLRVAERISSLEPDNVALARELAGTYLSKGDQKRALAKLQTCFKTDPKDVDTLNLLAQAFEGLGQTSKTASVYKELAKIYTERGRADEAARIWAKVAQVDPNDPDVAARKAGAPLDAGHGQAPTSGRGYAAPKAPTPAPARMAPPPPEPEPEPEPELSPPPPPAASSGSLAKDQLSKLLTETDVYVKYGLHDKALEHLRKIFSVDPENIDAHEKAYNIYVSANNHAQANDQLINVLRLCARNNEVQRAQPYLSKLLAENPGHPDVPTLLAVLRPGASGVAGPPEEALGEEAILVDSSDEEIIVADAPEDALAPQPEDLALASTEDAESNDLVAEDELSGGEALGDDVVATDGSGFQALAPDDEPLTGGSRRRAPEPELEPEAIEPQFLDDEPATQVNLTIPKDLLEGHTEPHGRKFTPAPPAELEPVEMEPAEMEPVELEPAGPEPMAVEEEAVEAPPDDEPASEECDEASFFLDQGLVEEAREILETVLIAYPGHERATELMARLESLAQGTPAESASAPAEEGGAEAGGKDAFDLAAELADELGELGGADVEEAPSAAGDDFQYSVEEVFSEFKKGLEKVVKPEDVDTHYDLGIAYKEMGLMDDAIGEFNVALQGCKGKKKELDCLTMVGMLQGQKGDHAAAVEAYRTALTSEHATGETAKALEFELGMALEALGSLGKALFHYNRVAKQDPQYRDAGKIVARLAKTTQEEDDSVQKKSPGANGTNGVHPKSPPGAPLKADPEAPATKARKVGYI